MTRAQARAAGLKFYNGGRPCKLNHPRKRWVSSATCYFCTRARNLQHSRDHAAEYAERNRAWDVANPDKRQAIGQRWRDRNAIEQRTRTRTYMQEHPEVSLRYQVEPDIAVRRLATTRAWNKRNPDRVRAYWVKYRALFAGAPGEFTLADIEAMLEAQGYCCATPGCGHMFIRRGFHIDHKQPLSRDGTNWPHNLQLLCRSCNTSKGDKTMPEFLAWRERVRLTRRG